ncbi:metalloendopeptidase OMA1, mitochondrial-like [Liolophura sinensis]|uniref:metalloendopeptidase OMA1, mitochondrial-like n=1 Tax=Liolophura sinensis TaxID=3198878 RepID=UPI0031588739
MATAVYFSGRSCLQRFLSHRTCNTSITCARLVRRKSACQTTQTVRIYHRPCNFENYRPYLQRRSYSSLVSKTCPVFCHLRNPRAPCVGGLCIGFPGDRTQRFRPFRTTPRAYIPPFIWVFLQPVAKLTALLTGRSFRKWHKMLPEHKKILTWANVRKHWYWLVFAGLACSGLIYAYYLSHLQETPVTHRIRFIVVTDEQFIKIAQHQAETFVQKYADICLPTSHPYYKSVVEITRRLVSSNHDFPRIKERTWTVNIVDDPERNAFVLPTGHIFVFTGLIKTTDNEDQLAAVIGHELAHALLSHAAEQLSFAQLVDWMIIAVMAAIWAVMPTDGIAVVTQWFYNKVVDFTLHLPYSRKLESEADKVGLQLCAKACFDVRESSAFWTIMDCLARLEGAKTPEWLSTHPANDTRVKHLDFIMPKMIEQRAACSCPQLPALDPRDRVLPVKKKTDSVVRALQTGVNLQQVHVVKPRTPQSA